MKKLGIILFSIFLTACNKNSTEEQTTRFVEEILHPVNATHVYGGTLTMDDNGVVATDVPPKVCVSSGTRLVKKGIITVNGVTPQRVSSAVLTELCYAGEKATLRFQPKK